MTLTLYSLSRKSGLLVSGRAKVKMLIESQRKRKKFPRNMLKNHEKNGIHTGKISGQYVVVLDLVEVHRHESGAAIGSGLAGQQSPGHGFNFIERIEAEHSTHLLHR